MCSRVYEDVVNIPIIHQCLCLSVSGPEPCVLCELSASDLHEQSSKYIHRVAVGQ